MSNGSRAGGLDLEGIATLIRNLRVEVPTDAPDVEPEDAAVALESCVREVEALRTALRQIAQPDELLDANAGTFNVHAACRMQAIANYALGAPERDLDVSGGTPQP